MNIEMDVFGRLVKREKQFLIEEGKLTVSASGTDYILFPQDSNNMLSDSDQIYPVGFDGYLVILVSGENDFYLKVKRKFIKEQYDINGNLLSSESYETTDLANSGDALKGGNAYEFFLRVGSTVKGDLAKKIPLSQSEVVSMNVQRQLIAFIVNSNYSGFDVYYSVFGVEV